MKTPTSFKAGWNVTKKVAGGATKLAGKGLTGAFAVEVANNIRQKDYTSAAVNAASMFPGKVLKPFGATGVGAMLYSAPLGNASADRAMGEKLKERVRISKGQKTINKIKG